MFLIPRGPRQKPGEQSRDARPKSNGGKSRDKTDYAHLRALTDADIEKAVAGDPDTFIPDAAWWKRARIVKPRIR